MNHNGNNIEARLWTRRMSYGPTLIEVLGILRPGAGLVFLRYADYKFQAAAKSWRHSSGRRTIGPADYQAVVSLLPRRRVLDAHHLPKEPTSEPPSTTPCAP